MCGHQYTKLRWMNGGIPFKMHTPHRKWVIKMFWSIYILFEALYQFCLVHMVIMMQAPQRYAWANTDILFYLENFNIEKIISNTEMIRKEECASKGVMKCLIFQLICISCVSYCPITNWISFEENSLHILSLVTISMNRYRLFNH